MTLTDQTRQVLSFSRRETRDLAVAWAAMAVAFAIFVGRPDRILADLSFGAYLVLVSALTVGPGFLCHELAHKFVAVRLGRRAAFYADYRMLVIAILSAIAGFVVAAPGAVRHYGPVSPRENGLIAVAGPITNLVLVAVFLPLVLLGSGGILDEIGGFGVLINAFLAAFNMVPFGPLDGRKVLAWDRGLFAGLLLAGVSLSIWAFVWIGYPF